MSTPALAARAVSVRVMIAHDVVALTSLAALAVLLVARTWATWGDLAVDTGYDLLAAERVASGELPYVDFTYYYGPLAPALFGLAAFVGGGGLAPAVVLGLAVALAIVGATYALARTQVGALGSFLAAALALPVAFAPTNLSFVLPHTASAPLGLLAALAFLLALRQYAATGGTASLVCAGAAAGAAALTRPEFAAAVFAAAIVWLALRARAGATGRRELLLFAAPALAIPAAVYGAFLTSISAHRLVLENLYPVDTLSNGPNRVLDVHAPLTATSFVELGARLALYAAGAAVLVLLAVALDRPRVKSAALIATVAGAVVVAAAALGRPEALRHGLEFVYGWIPAGAAVAAVLLARRARRAREWSASDQVALATAVVLAVVAAKTYAAFFVHSPLPQYAVYAFPLAAVLIAALHLGELGSRRRSLYALGCAWLAFLAVAGVGLTLKDARAESAIVRGPGGSIAASPAQAQSFQTALDWISRTTKPGEPVLLAPQMTALYTLADRPSPLRELALSPGALSSAADERAAVEALRRADVRVAVIDRSTYPEFGHTTFGGSFDRIVDGWIRSNFTRVDAVRPAGGRPIELWIRRTS